MGHQKIQGLLAHLKGHQRPLSLVFALAGKAIFTVEIAGVGHVEAKGFDHVAVVFVGSRHWFISIRRKQLVFRLQGFHIF